MKKLCFMMLLIGVFSIAVQAQSTRIIKGAVVDKNGNPLPAAVVEATGSSESTKVEADGTFSIEVPVWLKTATAKCDGMRDNTMKVQQGDMVFSMKPSHSWFLDAAAVVVTGEQQAFAPGIMFGKMANWGYYGKFMILIDDDGCPAGTAGLIKGLNKTGKTNFYAFLGAGYFEAPHYNRWRAACMIEGGLIINYKHFNASIGYARVTDFGNDTSNNLTFGVGYSF